MADPCAYMVWRGDYLNPPEFCPNDADPGEDYCLDHLPEDVDRDPWAYEGEYE